MVKQLVFSEKKNIQEYLWMRGDQNLIKEDLKLYVNNMYTDNILLVNFFFFF